MKFLSWPFVSFAGLRLVAKEGNQSSHYSLGGLFPLYRTRHLAIRPL